MNGGDHVQSARARELHRVGPDITTAPVNDDGLSFMHLGVIEQHLPRGDCDNRN